MNKSVLDVFSKLVKGFAYRRGSELRFKALHLHQLVAWSITHPRDAYFVSRQWAWQNTFTFSSLWIIIWILVLRWGEVTVFTESINQCRWDTWETLPQYPSPHHLVFVADPQLVDPHTYPGRPWPLSTLTVKHTDLYMRRSYSRLQADLDPDTIFFLGDLFDGGREWSAATTKSFESRYHKYGELFWQQEFGRFGRIFLRDWSHGRDTEASNNKVRRIIPNLPGNHDLGFGRGIQVPIRDRFQTYFGDSNRVDILGNHTFVSVDTLSLSAREQDRAEETEIIWKPVQEFLETANDTKAIAVDKYFRLLYDQPAPQLKYEHQVHELADLTFFTEGHKYSPRSADFPTILLSHVPLFRNPGTPCGPLRERFPPTPPRAGSPDPVLLDDRNAIPIQAGYQYQNVLSKDISTWILEKLDGSVKYVFSGDDHDYCELVHHAYPSKEGGIREITVKSISWAMGVRHPGFLMVALWNPVDENGKALHEEDRTLQTHLCLLPDQLSIFIRYAALFGICILALLLRSIFMVLSPPKRKSEELTSLPLFNLHEKPNDSAGSYPLLYHHRASSSTSSSSSPEDAGARLSSRNGITSGVQNMNSVSGYAYSVDDGVSPVQTRSRKSSLAPNPHLKSSSAGITWTLTSPDEEPISTLRKDKSGCSFETPKSFAIRLFREWLRSIWSVARIVLLCYFFLLFY